MDRAGLLLVEEWSEGTMLTSDHITAWINKTAGVLRDNRTCLTALDSAIGDADHGNNMDRGFRAVLERLPDDRDIGVILKAVAMALISRVGGAAGPLYGTMFLQAAKALGGKTELSADDVEAMLKASVDGVAMRGGARAGEKTMLDSLIPAHEAFREARTGGAELTACLAAAAAAAEEGMKATIPLIATKGRASYLGERSRGHQDPGATSSYLIIEALHETAVEAGA